MNIPTFDESVHIDIPLYIIDKSAGGRMRVWHIAADATGYVITHGLLHGEKQSKRTNVLSGKSTRTIREQIELEVNSKVNRQIDKGYSRSMSEAQKGTTNALGLLKPMLAQTFEKVKNVNEKEGHVQRKYDGHRCLITRQQGEVMAYSRNGKPITSIQHILDDIDIAEGETLDGELYHHGTPLQTISSWVRKAQESSKLLKYYNYDIIASVDFAERLELMRGKAHGSNVVIAETWLASDVHSLYGLLELVREQGYEGLILRQPNYSYEDGKRSKGLLKIKAWFDDEFKIIGISESKDGWAILDVITHDGKEFSVTAPGTVQEKEDILDNADDYLGKYVQIQYSGLTKAGVPFHPVATFFRNKGEE